MTEVNNDNFKDMLPVIEDSIRHSTFIAIDTEMTGLVYDNSCSPTLFDTIDQRYAKQRRSAQNFIICQFGLAVFTYDHKENTYSSKTYSFYLCPRSLSTRQPTISLDLAAIEFLLHNKFDFDKFLRSGLNYLNQEEEEELRTNFEKHLRIDFVESPFTLEELFLQIANWLSSRRANQDVGNQLVLKCRLTVNPLVNYALVRELRKKFPSVRIVIENRRIIAKPLEICPNIDFIVEDQREREQVIDDMIGFSKVFKIIVESKRPIVGHNLINDLLLTYNSFYRPLPKRLKDYKSSLHSLFPFIFDTKCILHNEKKNLLEIRDLIKNKSLCEIYCGILNDESTNNFIASPKIEQFKDKNHLALKELNPHNAGFDAFITGFIFIKVGHILMVKNLIDFTAIPTHSWFEFLKAIERHCNKINLIRANTHYMCISESDPKTVRPKWLVATKRNRHSCFSLSKLTSALASNGTSDVRMIGESAALIAVNSHVVAQSVIDAFAGDPNMKVTKYDVCRHNRAVRSLLWTTLTLSATVTTILSFKLIQCFKT